MLCLKRDQYNVEFLLPKQKSWIGSEKIERIDRWWNNWSRTGLGYFKVLDENFKRWLEWFVISVKDWYFLSLSPLTFPSLPSWVATPISCFLNISPIGQQIGHTTSSLDEWPSWISVRCPVHWSSCERKGNFREFFGSIWKFKRDGDFAVVPQL